MSAAQPPTVPSFQLDGRRALVTGGGRGIGRACALALALAGAEVAVSSRTEAQLRVTVEAIEAAGGHGLPLCGDLSSAAGVEAVLVQIARTWPAGADILVNNAAISPYVQASEDLADDAWSEILAVNLQCAVRITRGLASSMLARGAGAIVNIGSVAAARGLPRLSAYSASKGALEAWTRALAVEWASRGVRVNAVAPGYVETQMTSAVRQRDKLRAWVEGRTPMGRFGHPEEVAGAVVFLASDAASYITGATLRVDGGWAAA